MKPTGKQNALEWVIDFTRGIVTDNVPRKELNNFHLLAFTLFSLRFVANNIGLVTKIVLPSETTLWKSPDSRPVCNFNIGIYYDHTYSSIRGEEARFQRLLCQLVPKTL